jgi:hypothetical protein
LRVFQSVQLSDAKVNQTILRREPEVLLAREMKSPAPAGFQSQFKGSLTPAQANRAIGQAKKIWLQSSCSPQRVQKPVAGPLRFATCYEVGRRFLMSCHMKTLILGGTLARQTSLKRVTAAPCDRLR